MTTTPAIDIAGLTKSFGDNAVLEGVDLRVPVGSIRALLGSNGAGMTTVVRILSTLVLADGGRAWVDGHDVADEPARVGQSISLTGQFAAVDEILTARENLVMIARFRHLAGAERIADDLLARSDLTEAGGRRVATHSGGMRRRLDIAMSLVGDPRMLFLDEPTAEQLADGISILHGGRTIADGTLAELKALLPPARVEYLEEPRSCSPSHLLSRGLAPHVEGGVQIDGLPPVDRVIVN